MTVFRHYSDEVEALAARWRGMSLTKDRWNVLGKASAVKGVPGSESAPDIAQCGPLQCVMKPGEKKVDDKYRAAQEKIASDLGFDLDIAVAPVILWDRGPDTIATQEQYVCLVAWAFDPVHTWDEAEAALGKAERDKAAADVCAMWPFETWIAAQDRGGKHLLVSLPNSGGTPQKSNIDYAFAMLDSWGSDPAHPSIAKPPWCAALTADQAAINEVIERIEKFDETKLKDIVNRIPDEFLPRAQKDIIIANLLKRQQKIRALYTP
jgi:hypothetical protein